MSLIAWFTNCWEEDYRCVLRPEFLASKLLMYDEVFDKRFVTINNVSDLDNAKEMAEGCVRMGVIDEYFIVSDHQSEAFRELGIPEHDVRRVQNFTNWISVAITKSTCEFLVHCAADITFTGNRKWVTQGISLCYTDSNVVMVTPASNEHSELERQQGKKYADNVICHPGITDTCFVLRRDFVHQKIYSDVRHDKSHFPLSHFGACWEERLDAYVRNNGLYRLILQDVRWIHWGKPGHSHPKLTLWDRLLRKLSKPNIW